MEMEDKLDRLQKISKSVAIFSFAAFMLLIAYSTWRLRQIYQEIGNAQSQLAAAQRDKAKVEAEIAKLNADLEDKKKQIAVSNTVLGNVRSVAPEVAADAIKNALSADPGAAKALPRVYLHIGEESQRDNAARVAKALQSEGFVVPKIENVGSKIGRNLELRYCKNRGNEYDVEHIGKLLAVEKLAIDKTRVLELPSCANVGSSRSYELWLGNDATAYR